MRRSRNKYMEGEVEVEATMALIVPVSLRVIPAECF